MSELINVVEPVQKSYVLELTQEEVDVLTGIMADFLDNPHRKVSMLYSMDDSHVIPNENGMRIIESALKGFSQIEKADNYDYHDYWEEIDLP